MAFDYCAMTFKEGGIIFNVRGVAFDVYSMAFDEGGIER